MLENIRDVGSESVVCGTEPEVQFPLSDVAKALEKVPVRRLKLL